MGRIDTQFAKYVLAVGGDGVDAGKTLVGNLLRRLTLSDGAHNLRLSFRQDAGTLFLFLLVVDDDLQCALTDVAVMTTDGIQCIADVLHRSVFVDDAELMGRIDDATNELRRQFVADKDPV